MVMFLVNFFMYDICVYKEVWVLVIWVCDVMIVVCDGKDLLIYEIKDGIVIECVLFVEVMLVGFFWFMVLL